MIVNIVLRPTEPPEGRVVAGPRQVPFAGLLELFQILADLVQPADASASLPRPHELPTG